MEEHIDLFKKILTKIDDKVDYADIRERQSNTGNQHRPFHCCKNKSVE